MNEISVNYKTAVELNQRIIITAQAAQQNLYEMCALLKQMRDDLRGRCTLVTVEHSEWNGKKSVRVKWCNDTKYPECRHKDVLKASSSKSERYAGGTDNLIKKG